jgi:NADH-quinone oxidoreductase subunit L
VDAARHPALAEQAEEFHGATALGLHGLLSLPFALALAGVVAAWFLYLVRPELPARLRAWVGPLYRLLDNKYYLDRINAVVFAGGARKLGWGLWKGGDELLIDGAAVNGTARLVAWFAGVVRHLQSGFIYHYAFTMLVGVGVLLWFLLTVPYVLPTLRGH